MFRLLIVCLAALLFSSCLDSHEEVWINADGSGKARVQISLPLQAVKIHGGEKGVKALVDDYLKTTPAFTTYSLDTSVNKDQLEIDVSITFDDARELTDIKNSPAYENLPDTAGDMIGFIEIKLEGTEIHFQRQIDLTRSIPGSSLIPKEQLKGHKLTTIVHLPKAASSHNATANEDSGKSLTWTTPLAAAFEKPIQQSFIMPIPIPWLKIGLVAMAVILPIASVFIFFRRRKKARAL